MNRKTNEEAGHYERKNKGGGAGGQAGHIQKEGLH